MDGFFGQVLKIDLTAREWIVEAIGDDILETYLGGKGLGTYLLYENNPVGVDPMTPENCLIFATGPATGSAVWGGCRYGVFTKSPRPDSMPSPTRAGKCPKPLPPPGSMRS